MEPRKPFKPFWNPQKARLLEEAPLHHALRGDAGVVHAGHVESDLAPDGLGFRV